MTERLHFHFSFSCIGEGNGSPLSCLENLRDGGAWWAAIYGVAQSRTRLKWLSSYLYASIENVSHSVMSSSLRPHRLQPLRLLCPWNFPGKNTGMVIHSPLQDIFPTQGLNPSLLHCRQILYHLSHHREVGMCVCYRSAVTPVTKDSSSKCPINMRLHPHKAFKVCSTLYSKTKTVIICLM